MKVQNKQENKNIPATKTKEEESKSNLKVSKLVNFYETLNACSADFNNKNCGSAKVAKEKRKNDNKIEESLIQINKSIGQDVIITTTLTCDFNNKGRVKVPFLFERTENEFRLNKINLHRMPKKLKMEGEYKSKQKEKEVEINETYKSNNDILNETYKGSNNILNETYKDTSDILNETYKGNNDLGDAFVMDNSTFSKLISKERNMVPDQDIVKKNPGVCASGKSCNSETLKLDEIEIKKEHLLKPSKFNNVNDEETKKPESNGSRIKTQEKITILNDDIGKWKDRTDFIDHYFEKLIISGKKDTCSSKTKPEASKTRRRKKVSFNKLVEVMEVKDDEEKQEGEL